MKRIVTVISLFLILCSCFISCSNQSGTKSNKVYESFVKQLEGFNLNVEQYDNEKINSIENDIKQIGIEINGGLTNVLRYSKEEEEFDNITYVYIYEFELENDAYKFNKEYPSNFNPNEFYSINKSNIVVFGNTEDVLKLEI